MAADIQQREAVVLVMQPGVNQAEPQDLHAIHAVNTWAAPSSTHGCRHQPAMSCTPVTAHDPYCMAWYIPSRMLPLVLTFSTLLMTLKHTAAYSWSCQLVSSFRSR
jgi:hypothetical protein